MGPDIRFGAVAEVSADPASVQQMGTHIGASALRGLDSAITKSAKDSAGKYGQALSQAAKVGHVERMKHIKQEYKSRQTHIESLAKEAQDYDRAARMASTAEEKRRLARERDGRMRMIKQEQRIQQQFLSDQIDGMEKVVDVYEKGMDRAARSFNDKLEEGADNFASVVEKVASGDLGEMFSSESLKKAFKGAEGVLAKGGGGLTDMAAGMAGKGLAGGAMKGVVAGLGSAATALAGAAGVIAGAAVAIGAVVAVFAMGYGKIKEMNKALLEGISYFDMGAQSAEDFSKRMDALRGAVNRTSRRFALASEEVIAVATAMNEAGLTMQEIQTYTGTADRERAFTKALSQGIKVTKALGIEVGEFAQLQQNMFEAQGTNLRSLSEQMQNFGSFAQMAGMNTKAFYNAVSETTAGMALYNFRLEDTAELMTGLVQILGEDLAKAQIQSQGTFKGSGTLDRFKSTMTGGGALTEVLKANAKRQIEGFERSTLGLSKEVRDILKGSGLTDATGRGLDVDTLAKLSSVQLGMIQNELQDAGQGGAARSLSALRDQARLLSGGATGIEKAVALQGVDRPTEIAAQVAQALGVLNVKDLDETKMGVAGMAAFEQMTGLQGEQFKVTKEIFQRVAGRLAERGETDTSAAAIAKAIASDPSILMGDEREKLEAAAKDQQDPMLTAAEATLNEVQTIGDMISNTIGSYLADISEGVTSLVDLFTKKWFSSGSEERREARATSRSRVDALKGRRKSVQERRREIERDKEMESSEKDAALEKLDAEEMRLEDAMDREREFQRAVESDGLDSANRDYIASKFGLTSDMSKEEQNLITFNKAATMLPASYRQDYKAFGGSSGGFFDGANTTITEATYMRGGMTLRSGGENFETYMESMNPEMVVEGLREAEKQAEEAERKRQMDEKEAKRRRKEQVEGIDKVAKEIEEMRHDQRMEQVGKLLAQQGTLRNQKQIQNLLDNPNQLRNVLATGGTTIDEAGILQALGADVSGIRITEQNNDFIYRGSGRGGIITPINSYDELLGYTSRARGGGTLLDGLGSGGGGIVVREINIYESSNPQETIRIVKRALREGRGNA